MFDSMTAVVNTWRNAGGDFRSRFTAQQNEVPLTRTATTVRDPEMEAWVRQVDEYIPDGAHHSRACFASTVVAYIRSVQPWQTECPGASERNAYSTPRALHDRSWGACGERHSTFWLMQVRVLRCVTCHEFTTRGAAQISKPRTRLLDDSVGSCPS